MHAPLSGCIWVSVRRGATGQRTSRVFQVFQAFSLPTEKACFVRELFLELREFQFFSRFCYPYIQIKEILLYILLLSPYLHLIFIVFSNFSKRIAKFGKSNVKVTKIILERFGKRERKEPPFINHPHTYTSGKPNTSRSNPPPPDNRAAGFALKLQRSSSARRQKQWHFAVAKTEKENR